MDDKFTIRVNVVDRYYPLKIQRKDEETIRRAAKLINDKVVQYKQRYTDKDVQDFLAMASLQFVIKLLEGEGAQSIEPFLNELSALETKLDDLLDK
ncbi:MAG: cell division protein ZapA [Bacteroidales bacterium]|jgi:cell division protein ZapA|nr:cell division protein ZapA [Bacteroidales bacterium]